MKDQYSQQLKNSKSLVLPSQESWAKSVYWMYAVLVSNNSPVDRDTLRKKLKENGIDTRDFFIPLHRQPVFHETQKKTGFPVSDDLSKRGLYLPSGLAITDAQIKTVTDTIKSILP